MNNLNPIDILEKTGVDDFHVFWGKKTVQLKSKQDLLRIMAQFGQPYYTAFMVDGWLFTTERLVEKYGTFP